MCVRPRRGLYMLLRVLLRMIRRDSDSKYEDGSIEASRTRDLPNSITHEGYDFPINVIVQVRGNTWTRKDKGKNPKS
jgi:hypothetical protein